ncbi:caldesmon-like [Panicum virgatum]|uniref:SHSP domain-containing protein n=1 Tax=Panicum virgatum TaxID=38727 RepID=A0A8T0RZA2_PANVG|nr:caldesmon-like [Panicum virgatum]KAG2589679.1 hypothetical protein PVAP13_5NG379700 [Panicum virgatum]
MAASRQAPAAAENVDPVYEWLDDGDSYLLNLNLPEFKKEDFRVHVDGEGRLTVIGQRRPAPGAGGGAKAVRLHKAFQLPNTANLDGVSGRFDGTVLTIRVPKLQQEQEQQPAATPLPPPSTQAKEEARVPGGGKPAAALDDRAAKQVGRDEAETEQRRTIEAAERASLTAARKEEDDKAAKAKPVAPPPPSQQQPREEKVARGGDRRDDEDEKARAEHKEKVAREAERRIEAARARVAEAKAKAERERQCEHWKERAVEEGLKLADAVSKKTEVIATAVAAFTLGVFVSHKLFSRS